MRVLTVVPGPDAHGVVQHALAVAGLVGASVQRDLSPVHGQVDLVHVAFTDGLFGGDIASAAAAFERWADTVDPPLVVTLHDVPGADRDRGRDLRRGRGYARVVAAADAVVVCSQAEAQRLDPAPVVVPLPVPVLDPPGPVPAWADRPTVGVLGFVYPGKGHDRVVAAAPPGTRVVAIGAASPGHEDLVDALHRQAHQRGVDLVVTGPLPEADLHAAARAVTVPVAAYATTGSSASLVTWLAAGRRPVTTAGAYAEELALRWPGCLLPAGDLGAAVRAALDEPAGTWGDAPVGADVRAAHLALYEDVLR